MLVDETRDKLVVVAPILIHLTRPSVYPGAFAAILFRALRRWHPFSIFFDTTSYESKVALPLQSSFSHNEGLSFTMPKAGRNKELSRVARMLTTSNPLATTTKKADGEDAPTLSRGQRKRQAKREQYLKKEKMILSTLLLKKQEEQKKRIDGLDAIRDALLDTTKGDSTAADEPTVVQEPHYGTNRARKGLVTNEFQRMELVMQHPAFQENPFGAIQEHLKNTFAAHKDQREKEGLRKEKADKKKKEERKEAKKDRLRGVKKTRKYKPRRCSGR